MVNKKAISPIITTVLLIMISIAAVAIVASFVVPYIGTIGPKGDCFKAIDQIEIDTSSKYTCYYMLIDGAGNPYAVVNASIKRGAEPLGIEQFIVNVYGGGRSEKFDIKKETPTSRRILMYGSNPVGGEQDIDIPERSEMVTYSLKTGLTEVTSVEIAPVVKGNIFCNAADRQNIEEC
jgi:flagellin-like protein